MVKWLLAHLCRTPDETTAPSQETPAEPLAPLRRDFPSWCARLRGSRVVDFGSGWGFQSVALAKLGANEVLALETGEEKRSFTQRCGAGLRNLRVRGRAARDDEGKFDFVVSLDALEHYGDPEAVVSVMRGLLRKGGRLLLSFGPPWYSPYGAHLQFMSRVPWIHLFFSEAALMDMRARYRKDGAHHYSEVEGGLNQMTIARFEQLMIRAGFRVEEQRYRCVKGQNWLARIPLLRELFINEVVAVAVKI